jgi:hypothetical protein
VVVGLLMAALCFAVAAQRDNERLTAAAVYVVPLAAYDVIAGGVNHVGYYVGAAIVNYAVIILLSRVPRVGSTTMTLQSLSYVAMWANIVGGVAWWQYHPPHVYNAVFIAIYACALIHLIINSRSGGYVGRFAMVCNRAGCRGRRAARNN